MRSQKSLRKYKKSPKNSPKKSLRKYKKSPKKSPKKSLRKYKKSPKKSPKKSLRKRSRGKFFSAYSAGPKSYVQGGKTVPSEEDYKNCKDTVELYENHETMKKYGNLVGENYV